LSIQAYFLYKGGENNEEGIENFDKKKSLYVNLEALLLFGSGLNHALILSRNHVSCGDHLPN